MSQPNTILKVAVPGLIAAVAVIGAIFMSSSESPAPADEMVQEEVKQAEHKPDADTIGGQWNWDGVNMQRNKKTEASAKAGGVNGAEADDFPYTPEVIYQALEKVRLDKDGNLVIDHVTLAALIDALGSTSALLTDEHLAVLQEIIQVGLAGPAGEQAAELVGNFHEYLKANADLIALSPSEVTPAEHRKQYEEMQALRAIHLGDAVAKGLFAQTDTDSYYMMDSMEIETLPNLSKEEKAARQQAVVDKHIADTISLHGLEDKFQKYQHDRELIYANYPEGEEREQKVQEAKKENFTTEELNSIRHVLF